jgi:phage protein U
MTKPLYQLGSFQFDLPNGVPQTVDRTSAYRWEEQGRLLRDPAQQFLGPGTQEITLDGVMYPGFSGRQATMDTLRNLARDGKPVMFTDGLGKVYGKWVIKTLREGKGTFAPGGGAREINFSVSLAFYGEDNPGQAASPLSVNLGSGYLGAIVQAVGTPLSSNGSAFQAVSWATSPQFSAASQAAQGAGFNLGQLGAIAKTVGNGSQVSGALGAFGLQGLSTAQQGAWQQLGINPQGLLQAMNSKRGAAAMSVAVDALRSASTQQLQQLAGNAYPGLQKLVQSRATIATVLNVDPKITDAVRQAVQS